MRVVVTGAAGAIGSVVVPGLADLGHDVVAVDLVDVTTDRAVETVVADCAEPEELRSAVEGADAVVHLAGIPSEAPFVESLRSHAVTTWAVLETLREHGAGRRAVLASSNHAVGLVPRADGELTVDAQPRPDTHYGVGKVAMEAVGRLYVDRHGFDVVALRIGSFLDRPTSRRALATWLSPRDTVRLVQAALTAPAVGYAVVYGISANTRRWWDLGPGQAIGYHPEDDAEAYAAEVEATPETDDDRRWDAVVGGPMAD